MLIISMSFFNAGGGAAIALMARGAAKFFGIVNLQQLRRGMAGKRLGILVGFPVAILIQLYSYRVISGGQVAPLTP